MWVATSLGVSGAVFLPFTFVVTCLVALSTGSSICTMFMIFPVLVHGAESPGRTGGAAGPGAIVSGAIFGDHLAPISDTTIISLDRASASASRARRPTSPAWCARVRGTRSPRPRSRSCSSSWQAWSGFGRRTGGGGGPDRPADADSRRRHADRRDRDAQPVRRHHGGPRGRHDHGTRRGAARAWHRSSASTARATRRASSSAGSRRSCRRSPLCWLCSASWAC